MVDKHITLAERLKNLRKTRGLSLAALGKKVGVSAQAVHKWESGAQIDAARRLALAQALSVPIEWFGEDESVTGDHADPYKGFPQFSSAVSANGESYVPFMPRELMLQWLIGSGKRIQGFERLLCPAPHGPRTFAMQISDTSMESNSGGKSYSPGDYIFVDPDVEVRPETRVVLYDLTASSSLFVLMRELYEHDGAWHVRALNQSLQSGNRKLLDEDVLVGTVIGTWRPE